MKKIILMLAFLLMANTVHADTTPAPSPARELQAVMKDMGATYKAVVAQTKDPAQTAAAIAGAAKLNGFVAEAATFYPDQLALLPADQQRVQQLQYLRAILNLRLATLDLEEALTAGNAQGVQDALAKLAQMRSNGHDQFKQD